MNKQSKGLEGKLDTRVGDLIRLYGISQLNVPPNYADIYVEVSGYVTSYTHTRIRLSHENPLTRTGTVQRADFSITRGNRTYDLREFNGYEVLVSAHSYALERQTIAVEE